MWLQLSVTVFLSSFVLTSYGQDAERGASLGRSINPRDGRCQYTFTVAAPAEPTGCPHAAAADQMEGVLSRLGLLEALVSRLLALTCSPTMVSSGWCVKDEGALGSRGALNYQC